MKNKEDIQIGILVLVLILSVMAFKTCDTSEAKELSPETIADVFADYDFTYLQADSSAMFEYKRYQLTAYIRSKCGFPKGYDKTVATFKDGEYEYRAYDWGVKNTPINYKGVKVDDKILWRNRVNKCNLDVVLTATELPPPPITLTEDKKELTASAVPSAPESVVPKGGCARSNGPSLGFMIFMILWIVQGRGLQWLRL